MTSAATAAKAFGDTYLRQFIELPTWAVAARASSSASR